MPGVCGPSPVSPGRFVLNVFAETSDVQLLQLSTRCADIKGHWHHPGTAGARVSFINGVVKSPRLCNAWVTDMPQHSIAVGFVHGWDCSQLVLLYCCGQSHTLMHRHYLGSLCRHQRNGLDWDKGIHAFVQAFKLLCLRLHRSCSGLVLKQPSRKCSKEYAQQFEGTCTGSCKKLHLQKICKC